MLIGVLGRQDEGAEPDAGQSKAISITNLESKVCSYQCVAPEAGQKEIFSSWALFIMIVLLILALFTSYILQQRKIQAVHETVLSIFAGTSELRRGTIWLR